MRTTVEPEIAETLPTEADGVGAPTEPEATEVEGSSISSEDSYPPDSNKPGRRSPAVAGELLSSIGAREWPHNPNDPADVEAMLIELFGSPEYKELAETVDAELSLRVTGYGFRRSQYLGILIVNLIGPSHDLKGAHRYAQTQPVIRALLGFEPMSAETRQANLLRGRQTPICEEAFPSRQSVVKFIDGWMRSRADWLLPFMQDLVAKAAFRAILDYNLNATRIAFDTAPCYSGLRRQGGARRDEGALHWSHGTSYFGRQWGAMTLGDCGVILSGRARTPQDESKLAENVFIPELHRLSEALKGYAAERGIPDHPGFEGAGLFGDSAFDDLATVDAAYKHGFEPGFTSIEAGKKVRIIGKRRVKVVGVKGKYAILQMSNRGRFYCTCDARKPLHERRPMQQVANRFGIDFVVHCEHCSLNNVWYRVSLRGADDELPNGRWRRGDRSTLVRALRHDDRRTIAVSHNIREHHESSHSMLRHMGLLAKERLSQRKHITGNFRHELWYTLAALVYNLIIIHNLAAGRVSREKLDWNDQFVSAVRNAASAIEAKAKRAARRVSDADRIATKQRKQNRRRTSDPPLRQAA